MTAQDRAARGEAARDEVVRDDAGRRGLPDQVTMGLLDYVTAHSLDEDYEHVARRDGAQDRGRPGSRRGVGTAGLVVVGLFGLLVMTAAVQTARDADDRATGRQELLAQVEDRRDVVRARRAEAESLRAEVEALEQRAQSLTREGRTLSAQVDRLARPTGALALTGPGVRVVVDDAPGATTAQQRVLDRDLQRLVNALWSAGAEAVAVNDQRLTSLSAIRQAGAAITVNYESVNPPYVVDAIGDPDTMPARFVDTRHGAEWFDLQRAVGLRFELTTEGSVTVPAAARLDLRLARPRAVVAQ